MNETDKFQGMASFHLRCRTDIPAISARAYSTSLARASFMMAIHFQRPNSKKTRMKRSNFKEKYTAVQAPDALISSPKDINPSKNPTRDRTTRSKKKGETQTNTLLIYGLPLKQIKNKRRVATASSLRSDTVAYEIKWRFLKQDKACIEQHI